MVTVIALQSFEHNGKRRRNSQFAVSAHQANALVRQGLVAIKGSSMDPAKAVGVKSSASPAAPVSPQATSKQSKRGGRRKKAEASSSPTQLFE